MEVKELYDMTLNGAPGALGRGEAATTISSEKPDSPLEFHAVTSK